MATGDIGFIHDERLYIVDREKNVIIRHGENFSAAALEEEIADRLGVCTSRVMVFDSDPLSPDTHITAIVEQAERNDGSELLERLAVVAAKLPLAPRALVVTKIRALPRTTSGKKMHAEARRLLRTGALPIVAERKPPEVSLVDLAAIPQEEVDAGVRRGQVLRMVQETARRCGCSAPVTELSRFAGDLLIDSLALFELVVNIEARLGLSINDDWIVGAETVRDLLDVVDRSAVSIPDNADEHRDARPDAATRLFASLPGISLVADAQKQRQILVNGRWMTDFASCNYLGFDLEPEIAAAIAPMVERWGTHPSWTRAVASPEPYRRLESELAELVGAVDTVVFPTVTLVHMGVLPRLAGVGGAILLTAAHTTRSKRRPLSARAHGATVLTWAPRRPRGARTLPAVHRLQRHEGHRGRRGLLDVRCDRGAGSHRRAGRVPRCTPYVDDAHGFGVIGSRPTQRMPYGYGGSGVVRHAGLGYDRIIYVAGLSKAYSSLAAFVTLQRPLRPPVLRAGQHDGVLRPDPCGQSRDRPSRTGPQPRSEVTTSADGCGSSRSGSSMASPRPASHSTTTVACRSSTWSSANPPGCDGRWTCS
ncbi:MAG: phosphopantetheine-binding protein [Acidimicrobiales bacterium]